MHIEKFLTIEWQSTGKLEFSDSAVHRLSARVN